MYRTRFFVVAALGLALVLSALQINGIARANFPVPSVTFVYQRLSTLEAGRVWTDQSGMHIRDRVDLGLLTGGLQGSARVVYNADLVFTAGGSKPVMPPDDGVAYGTIEIFSSEMETAMPVWNGAWTYNLLDGRAVSGSLTATHTSETLKLIVFSVTQGRNGIIHTGYIEQVFCLNAPCSDPSK